MENSRNGKTIAVVALVVAVLCLSVGFATISATLTVNGKAEVQNTKDSWGVKFQNIGEAVTTGKAAEATKPAVVGNTSINSYSVNLLQPGDSIYYDFEIANTGKIDAELTGINFPSSLTCGGEDPNKDNVCNNLEYTFKYVTDNGGKAVAKGDKLAAGATTKVRITVTYKDTITAEQLPKADVPVTNLGFALTYSQDGVVTD